LDSAQVGQHHLGREFTLQGRNWEKSAYAFEKKGKREGSAKMQLS